MATTTMLGNTSTTFLQAHIAGASAISPSCMLLLVTLFVLLLANVEGTNDTTTTTTPNANLTTTNANTTATASTGGVVSSAPTLFASLRLVFALLVAATASK